MKFVPHTESEIAQMLAVIGVDSIEALFESIPQHLRLEEDLSLPGPLDEASVLALINEQAERNTTVDRTISFLGAGAYDHYVPSVVRAIAARGEFLTSYTPYQPELSQGTLQAQFEFQTMVARLLGLQVANASMYEGATSLVEACRMAQRYTRREKIVVSSVVHPQYRAVLRTYLGKEALLEVPYGQDGSTDLAAAKTLMSNEVAALVVQSPNFFGVIEDLREFSDISRGCESLLVATFTEPLAFGLIEPPGNLGADIAAGEGQSLGLPLSFGGPYVGLLAARADLVKFMPGRLIGMTVDSRGNPCYTLTLSAREQHIRRARAGSNICTNEGLCALMVAVYLSLLGASGLQRLALYNHLRTEKLKQLLRDAGLEITFSGATFNEFVIRLRQPAEEMVLSLERRNIVPGYPLGRDYHDLKDCVLVCVTERRSDQDFATLVSALSGA